MVGNVRDNKNIAIAVLLVVAVALGGWLFFERQQRGRIEAGKALTQKASAEDVAREEIILKLWSRSDRSGPLRGGNIVAATELLNKQFGAAGLDMRVKVEVFENPAKGYDLDAQQLLRAFGVGKGPDLYVAAHEWVGEFAAKGYAMNMEDHIAQYPEFYSDIIPVLWESTKYKGQRYAIPQDTEVRMFFYNKGMLRKLGKSDEFIDGLPGLVEQGEFTIWDLSNLAKEVVDAGIAKYGMLHRPDVGPDYLMTFAAFGAEFHDPDSGKLVLTKGPVEEALKWYAWNVENGVTPGNMTSFSWDALHYSFVEAREAFIEHHGIWDLARQFKAGWPQDPDAYFKEIGWLHAPPAEKGGEAKNLSHPIVYVVNPASPHKDLAALVVALATQSYFNVQHAVGTSHIAINYGETSMPAYQEAWHLVAATPMLARSTFMPNHPKFGRYNGILFKGLQGVETGRLSPADAVEFIVDEMQGQLGDDVIIR